ncbi:hypothetical protein MACK_000729 [Theileria orientalis]|uniref:Uncharacterized protein n=1 Tax=Theileria orientalis TaxID=68886 RepID=A0A976MAH7_THEOR|nr:hypothetical protein MACK_000729 [Theileria orientalis]
MNTSSKRNFLTYISFKLSRKGRSITKRLFKLQISEDSAVITPLAPRTPLYNLFCKRAHRKRTSLSKLKNKLIALKRRSKRKDKPFQVLKPGDLNRLFAESETTPKVKPRKLFSKTPKIKSLFLKLKSRKSGTKNKSNEIVPYDSDVEKPLGVVASCFPAVVLFRRKTRGFKGTVSKLKRKLIALKRRSKRKDKPFQVLKPGDLNRLFAESETTPKVKPRKLFSKTPKIKSLFLKLKSRKSGTKNKSNEIVPYDSDVEKPLGVVASCFPAVVLFRRKTRGFKGTVSKLKRKLIALKRRSKRKDKPFQVLKPGDLNRLFAESETTPKVKPRKLFSKTPKIKSLFLKLKSRKSGTKNKSNEIVPYDSNIEKTSKRKYNKLRKYFSRMKSKWSLKVQKLRSPIVTFDESLYNEYKDVIKLLELFQGHMLPKMYIPYTYTEPLIEYFVEEYKDEVYDVPEVRKGDDNTDDHVEIVEIEEMPFEAIEELEIEEMPFEAIEELEIEEMPFEAIEELEIEEMPFEAIEELEIEEMPFEAIEELEIEELKIEQGNCLDVLFEGNSDLKLQFLHEEELTERFMNEASAENFITARFGSFELASPHEYEKPQGEEQPEKEPLCQPEYLQEEHLEPSQFLDELFEGQTIEDYPQEERLDQQQPLPEQPVEEHTEESAELELRLEDLQLKRKQLRKEEEYSPRDDMKLRDEELSILSELVDVISTDESVSRPLQEDDESSCSTITYRKEDWSWYYEQQETSDESQVLHVRFLDETVDEPQHLQEEPLDETVDEPQHLQGEPLDETPDQSQVLHVRFLDETVDEPQHLQEEPKEPETLEEDHDDDYYGPNFTLNLDKVHETMGLLDQYGLGRDHAQTTRACIDILNSREGSCNWYFISTTYEQRYNTAHLQRTGHLGVLPANKTMLEKDYVDGLIKDIMFRTFIVRTMLGNARKDLVNLAQASFITSSPALKCHLSPIGLEELLYKIGYNWDMTKSRYHQLLDLVAHANELARLAEDIPDDIYNSVNRINNFMVKMKNEYDSVMETMRVTKTCVLLDLNNECRASRGETEQQGRVVTQGCNHQGPLGANPYHRKAHESMFEHFCHVNSMLTALQRTVSLRKKARTQVKKQL